MLLLAAASLLLAVGLALGFLVGWSAPLGAALYRYDPALLNTAQAGIQRYVAPAVWDDAVLPLLEQPSWVLPVALGVLLLAVRALLSLRRRRRREASI